MAQTRSRLAVRMRAHAQVREDAAPLGNLDQAGLHHIAVVAVGEIGAVEGDMSAARGQQAADDVVQRRLAGAVAAQQRHDLARVHLKIDAVQHLGVAVAAAQIAHVEQWLRRANRCPRGRAHAVIACSRAAAPWPR